jgi:hypothetical protein
VVGICVWCPLLLVFGGWGVCVGKSSGSTRLRLWKGLVSTSVILNHCIKTRFLVFLISNVRVGVAEFYLQIFVGMLVSRIGGGSGGWASVPLWSSLELIRGHLPFIIKAHLKRNRN